MWKGILPAVTSKFEESGLLDHDEMARCFELQIAAGCDGLIVCGSLGEGPMLTHDERIEVLRIARAAAHAKPVLMTIAAASTAEACALAKMAARAGADGLMVVPSLVYHTNEDETVATLKSVAHAADLPVVIYSNPVAYRVDVTLPILDRLASDPHFVAIKESSNDVRRTTEILTRFGNRYAVLTGVDNLAFEALVAGAVGWVAGLVCAFPRETVALYRLIKQMRLEEAMAIYRWFRPMLDLDVSSYLVQNIKLVEALVIGSNDRVRMPRMPLAGEQRARIERIVHDALDSRPDVPASV